MSLNDPIADMLTRVRNAAQAQHEQVALPFSRIKESIARVLEREGFVQSVEAVGEGTKRMLVITLRYTEDRLPLFVDFQRISKPGRRIYISNREIKPLHQGAGISILSTPKGIMKDMEAQSAGVGGEVLCTIW